MKNKKIIKCPYKRPRPPRCLCQGFINWLLGKESKTLYLLCPNKKAIEYRRKLAVYERKCLAWYAAHKNGAEAGFYIIDEMHTKEGPKQ